MSDEQQMWSYRGPMFRVPPFEPQYGQRIRDIDVWVCPLYADADDWNNPTADWQATVRIGTVTFSGFGKGPDAAASGVRQMLTQALSDLHATTSGAVRRCNEGAA